MRIDQDVLEIISTAKCEGNAVYLTVGQLDPKTYKRVDAVLKACGGKWNRSNRAHLFATDASERIEVVLATGEVTTAREVGYFPTPPALARELVKMAGVKSGHHVLEPSAGTGNIVNAILAVKGTTVRAVEIDPARSKEMLFPWDGPTLRRVEISGVHDFMDCRLDKQGGGVGQKRFDRVVMNPPFTKVGKGDHIDHVHHAFEMLKPGGVLVSVMPASIEFRGDKRHREFRDYVLDGECGSIESLPEGSFRASGTDVRTCVIRMERS